MEKQRIKSFGYWRIPSGEGVIYLEGKPSDEDRKKNIERTNKKRRSWTVTDEAGDVLKQVAILAGKKIEFQLWDDLMFMLDEDEGFNPVSCDLLSVYVKKMENDGLFFHQLFIEFNDPISIDKKYLGGNQPLEQYFDEVTDSYHLNCGLLHYII